MLLIIAISTFVCISLGMLGVYWLLYKPQSAATERLRRLGANESGNAPGECGQGAVEFAGERRILGLIPRRPRVDELIGGGAELDAKRLRCDGTTAR